MPSPQDMSKSLPAVPTTLFGSRVFAEETEKHRKRPGGHGGRDWSYKATSQRKLMIDDNHQNLRGKERMLSQSLQNCERITFRCLKAPVCGNLWKHTQIAGKSTISKAERAEVSRCASGVLSLIYLILHSRHLAYVLLSYIT